jgi:hypothetical protein
MYLKGCYMHWMQSVQRMVSNYKVVPPGEEKRFFWLVYIFRTTENQQIFYSTVMIYSSIFQSAIDG